MKAWVLERYGDPASAFALRDRPDPVPGPGQVLIAAEGFGLNYADVMARRGLYREAPPVPCVIGYETVGRIERTGPGVPEGVLGVRVAAITRFTGYAERCVTDQLAVAAIPGTMDLGSACSLATQGCTAWYMSMIACPLRAGQRVLVHSAAGGVGHLLVQIAVRLGCEVFAVAGGGKKMDLLRSLGAHHIIDRTQGDYAEHVRALLRGAHLDVSFNAVGGSTFKKDRDLVGHGGTLVLYGGAERGGQGGGFFGTLRFVWSMGVVIPIVLMMNSKSLVGVNMLRIGEHHPALLSECFKSVVKAAEEGWLRPHVERVFPAQGLPEAHALLESGRSSGKVCVAW